MILSIANQKGGCQKTTLNNQLGLFIHINLSGSKVCILDIDIQGSATTDRANEISQLQNDEKKQLSVDKLYSKIGKQFMDVVFCYPQDVKNTIETKRGEGYNVFIVDFPGTIQVESLVEVYKMLDYLFIPCDCDNKSINATFSFIQKIEEHVLRKNNADSNLSNYSVLFTLFDTNTSRGTNKIFTGLRGLLEQKGIDVLENSFMRSDYWRNGTAGSTILPMPNYKMYESIHPFNMLKEMVYKIQKVNK